VSEQVEDRFRQLHDDGDGAQQDQAHDEGEADADAAGAFAVGLGQLVGQDRDEDQVVDAEHDFHRDQRHKATHAAGSAASCIR
jgi:hypothetical protein